MLQRILQQHYVPGHMRMNDLPQMILRLIQVSCFYIEKKGIKAIN